MGFKRGFDDQTSNFNLTRKYNHIQTYVLQSTKVKINYKNTVVIKNKLYENYGFCPNK